MIVQLKHAFAKNRLINGCQLHKSNKCKTYATKRLKVLENLTKQIS